MSQLGKGPKCIKILLLSSLRITIEQHLYYD